MTNANELLFRCSALGQLMVEPKSKSEKISATTKRYLVEVFVNRVYGRMKDVSTVYTRKGLQVEEDSLTLLSRVDKIFYTKNEDLFSNKFICGTPDVIYNEKVIDVKSSWDIFTFFKTKHEDLNKDYYWQLQGYMELLNIDSAELVYCLVDTPESIIKEQKRKLYYSMMVNDDTNADYLDACKEIEKLSRYGDMWNTDKIYRIKIKRNPEDIERLYKRISDCRNYLNENYFTL